MTEEYLDQFTEIDDLMRESVTLSKEALNIIYNTNRNIYEILQGNLAQTGLINYQAKPEYMQTPEERKQFARSRYNIVDPRDGKAFFITKMIVDEYSKNISSAIRYTIPPYRYNATPVSPSAIEAYSFSDVVSALGLTYNPFRRDNLAITNLKIMGYHNLFAHPSSGLQMIFGAGGLPPTNALGMPRSTMRQYDVSTFSPTYGYSVGDEDVLEFDLRESPIIMRWDKNDIFFFDYNNLSGVEQHVRIAKTWCFLEPYES